MRSGMLFCILLFAVGFILADDVKSKIVNTDQGPVKGYKAEDGDYFEFYGIPYATAPTGPHKFKAALPGPQWTKVFEATRKGISCPQQTTIFASSYQEDCLIINVWVPLTEDTNLPVVVYVHGGAYNVGGSNMFTPRSIVNEGKVIGVDLNYRLGPHGFLCLGTEDAPGNAGMKDVVAALRWIQRNIASFGGNPNDVTISGYSAGSSAVDLLALSGMTQGLFHKVIPESGMGLSVWSIQKDPIYNAKVFAEQFNFKSNDVHELQEFYKSATFEQLIFGDFINRTDSDIYFVPCIERDIGQEMFLKEAPIEILKKGNIRKLPYLLGFGNMEGLMRANVYPKWKDQMNTNFQDFLPSDLQFKNGAQKKEVADKVKRFYFGDKQIGDDTIQAYVDYFTDTMFGYSIVKSALIQKAAGNNDIYLYEFSYVDDLILKSSPWPNIRGATHCAQTAAVANSFMDALPSTDEYKKMRQITRKAWINFIKTGKPVPEPSADFPEGWPATSADGFPYMDLNLPTKLHNTLLLGERARFWDEIYDKHYRLPIPPQNFRTRHSDL